MGTGLRGRAYRQSLRAIHGRRSRLVRAQRISMIPLLGNPRRAGLRTTDAAGQLGLERNVGPIDGKRSDRRSRGRRAIHRRHRSHSRRLRPRYCGCRPVDKRCLPRISRPSGRRDRRPVSGWHCHVRFGEIVPSIPVACQLICLRPRGMAVDRRCQLENRVARS